MQNKIVKIVTFAPESAAESVRRAMGDAGAGKIGHYTHCSFSIAGTGRFTPGNEAEPAIGVVGSNESVQEERIEMLCERELLDTVAEAIRDVHPYEEVPIEVYPVEVI